MRTEVWFNMMSKDAAKIIAEACGVDCSVEDLAEPCIFCGEKTWSTVKNTNKNRKAFSCCVSCSNDLINGDEVKSTKLNNLCKEW